LVSRTAPVASDVPLPSPDGGLIFVVVNAVVATFGEYATYELLVVHGSGGVALFIEENWAIHVMYRWRSN
jgi:hypothetical protein